VSIDPNALSMRAAEIRSDVIVAATIVAEGNEDWQMVRDVASHHRANDVASEEVLRHGW
jgi:hypothetical protein